MSAAAPIPTATASKALTYDDYLALTPPNSGNFELHHGTIIQMASPTPFHQDVAAELTTLLRLFVRQFSLGKVYAAPLDVVLDAHNTVQPDLLFVSNERSGIIGATKINGAPDLVIEIQSPSNTTQEMAYKKQIYASSGVLEYWVVDLQKKALLSQFVNGAEGFTQVGVFAGAEALESVVLPGLALQAEACFR